MAQQQQTMFVVIPAGVGPGQTFFVNTTSGQQVTVTVPPGCASGQQIQISVPTVLAAVPVVPANMGGGATKTGISGTGYDPDIMKKTRDLFEVPKTGTTVSAAMPTAPPLSSIDDTKVFDESGYQLESDAIPSAPPTSSVEEVSACVPVSEGTYFWTPQEMAQLQQQPLPLEYFKPTGANDAGAVSLPVANGIVVANDPSQVISQPVFVAGNGLPIVTRAVSGAETEYDGYKGVKSCDPILQNNVDEIMLFLQSTWAFLSVHRSLFAISIAHHRIDTQTLTPQSLFLSFVAHTCTHSSQYASEGRLPYLALSSRATYPPGQPHRQRRAHPLEN